MVPPELYDLVEQCTRRCQAQVVEVVLRGKHSRPVLEIFIDVEEGGVTTELCSAVSREISGKLEVMQLLPASYTLSVSSPGIDRPLKFEWQYRKHTGRKIAVRVRTPEGELHFDGTLTGANGAGILLQIAKEQVPKEIRFNDILEAKVVAPW